MSEDAPPYWYLLSVLFSSTPLTPPLAMFLYQVALDLYQSDKTTSPLAGDLVQGKMTNLKKDVLLGTIGGPAFEAEIDTERGHGIVRFLLTRQGLELMAARAQRDEALRSPQYLN
jgi:hypothetical protein